LSRQQQTMRGTRRITAWVALVAVVAVVLAAGQASQARAQNETSSDANPFSPARDESSPLPSTNNGTESPVNPFADDAAGSKICCCLLASSSSYSAFAYEDPATAPPNCCCGEPGVDCPDSCASSTYSSVCGSGQVCGILLLMAALVGTLAITICITGVFLARRRRQRNSTDQFLTSLSRPGRGPVLVNIVRIPDEQLKDLEIKDIDVDEEQGGLGQAECPICLETVGHQVVSEFPCGHMCCRGCRDDLVRHSSRVVNASTVAILCPLCRKMAVAPSLVGGRGRRQVILVQSQVQADAEQADAEQADAEQADAEQADAVSINDGTSAAQDASETNPISRVEVGGSEPNPSVQRSTST
jgi:hypothetical protein